MFKVKREPLISAVMLLISLGMTTSCIDNGYDLNKDIDLTISVGGDAFTIPLGFSEETKLSKLIEETETLKLEDGVYSIRKDDTIDPVDINVDDVNIHIDRPEFEGTRVNFEAKIDNFTITDKSKEVPLKAPEIDVNVDLPKDKELNDNGPIVKTNETHTLHNNSSFEFRYPKENSEWPKEVKTIKTVVLHDDSNGNDLGQKITFTVKTPANMIRIDNFAVTFPEGFILKNINGKDKGNSIQLATNNILDKTIATYEFYVYGQELNKNNPEIISINSEIKFDSKYTTVGTPNDNDKVYVDMGKTDFIFDHAIVATNEIETDVTPDEVDMSTTITGLDDINKIFTIQFDKNSPNIKIAITKKDPQLPVDFKDGYLVIEFPDCYQLKLEKQNKTSITYSDGKLIMPAVDMIGSEVELKLTSANLENETVENNQIKLEKAVQYYLKDNTSMILQSDEVSSSNIANLSGETLDIDITAGEMIIENAKVDAKAYTAEVKDETSFKVEQEVDNALSRLKTIAWKEGDNPKITLKINFSKVYEKGINKLNLTGLKIQMPKFIKFAADETDIDENNILTFKNETATDISKEYEKPLKTIGMDFSYMDDKGLETEESTAADGSKKRTLKIKEEQAKATITGNVKTLSGEILNTSELQGILVQPYADIDEMHVGKVTGTVDPVIESVEEEVDLDLGDDLDFLKDEGNELDIHNPQIKLTLKNTVGVPVDLELNMYNTDDNGKK